MSSKGAKFGAFFFWGLGGGSPLFRISVSGANPILMPVPIIPPRAFDAAQSLLSMILEQFEDRLVQILLAVAVLSGVLSAFEDDPHVSQ